jgi:FkbM family methyltransferase
MRLSKLSYNRRLTSVVRALGLRPLARKLYYLARRSADQKLQIRFMGLEAAFHVANEIELRTVELAFNSETEMLALVLRELRPGDTFLDVGANLGVFSVFAGLAGAHVWACEPEPVAYGRLERNLAINHLHDARVFPVALSAHAGTAHFTKPSNPETTQTAHLSQEGKETVRLMRGDSLLSFAKPSIIKIDVEGHELEVLSGLTHALAACRLCCASRLTKLSAAAPRELLSNGNLQDFDESRRGVQVHLIARPRAAESRSSRSTVGLPEF